MSKPPILAFEKKLDLPVSAAVAFAWHARPGAFDRLTPPWLTTEIVQDPHGIETGSRLIFRVRRGPLWVRWIAEHQDTVEGKCFTDVQISGPFAFWRHVHSFEATSCATTSSATTSSATTATESLLRDQIEYALPFAGLSHPLVGGFLCSDLERMFAFRHRVTLGDLELHRRYADKPRQNVVIAGGKDWLARTLSAMLTTGGHSVERLRSEDRSVSAIRSADSWLELAVMERQDLEDAEALATLKEDLAASCDALPEDLQTYLLILPATLEETLRESLPDICRRRLGSQVRFVVVRCGEILSPAGGWLAQESSWRLSVGLAGRESLPPAPASWISVDDAAAGLLHLILKPEIQGRLELTASRSLDSIWEATDFRLRHVEFVLAMEHLFGLEASATSRTAT